MSLFLKLQGLQNYFPEKVSCNLKLYESGNFSDFSLHRIPGCENLGFLSL